MAEREADRARPERLRQQGVVALLSEAGREISPEFRRQLREHDSAPGFFDAHDLAASARSGLEVEIARNIGAGQGAADAIRDAFRRRGESYLRELNCKLVEDRHPSASIVLGSVKKAFDEAAPIAARLILDGRPARRISDRVRLDEDLLVPPRNGAGP